MTDRIKALTIYFDSFDISEDSKFIEHLEKAIKCFRHVHSVKRSIISSDDHFAYNKGYHDAMMKIYDFLDKERKF